MPSNSRSFEFVRTRPRKDRDKDRDGDNHSQTGSTISALRERKHRKSHGSSTQSDAASTIKCAAESMDDLPPLPETEESETASIGTSPIMRTSSSISLPAQQTMPGSFDTPENLQPYLEESEEDTMSTINVPNRMTESGEWIGPRVESETSILKPLDDNNTPTPMPRKDPLQSASVAVETSLSNEKGKQPNSASSDDAGSKAQQSFLDSDMIYSWAAASDHPGQYYYPSQMSNPFVQTATKSKLAPAPAQAAPAKKGSPPALKVTESPKAAQVPTPSRPPRPLSLHETPSHGPYEEYHPVARIEPLPMTLQEQPPLDPGVSPGMMVPVQPSFSPIPMQHTQSNPLPYPGFPARMDHPTNILQRVGSVLPDITALMDLYYGTCHMLNARDQHVHEIEAQRFAESERQNQRIDSLTRDIQSMIRHHDSRERKLLVDQDHLDKKYKKLQEHYNREIQQRDEARSAHTILLGLHDQTKRKHKGEVEELQKNHTFEKERVAVIHESERQRLMDSIAQTAKASEEALATAEQKSATERQNLVNSHQQSETELAQMIEDLRMTVAKERAKNTDFKATWGREREEMLRQWVAEKALLQSSAEDQRQAYLAKHQKSMDDLQQQQNDTVTRMKEECDGKISKLQRDKAALQVQLQEMAAFHKTEMRSINEIHRKEKEEPTKTIESSPQRKISEGPATVGVLQRDKGPQPASREPSESRRLLEAQNQVAQLQKQNEELVRSRGPSQSRLNAEAQEIITRLQKENEMLKGDRLRPSKSKGEDPSHSRSTTPAPKEEKLERTRSNRASGIFSSSSSSRREKGEEGHRHHRLS